MIIKNWKNVRPRIVHENLVNYRVFENPSMPTRIAPPELVCLRTIRFISYDQLQPGMVSVPHQHPHEEVYFITKGKCEMLTDGENMVACEGDVIYIAPHDMHGMINTGDETLEFLAFAADVPQGARNK